MVGEIMKRKNNKGFTLIELLAVIVILILVMLIATNATKNQIKKSKIKAAKANGITYFKAVDDMAQLSKAEEVKYQAGLYDIAGLDVKVSGTKPDSGFVVINDFEVIGGCLKYGKYRYQSCGTEVEVTKGGTCNEETYECNAMVSPLEQEFAFVNTNEQGNPVQPKAQKYIVPKTGNYEIELWGAEGGKSYCDATYCAKNPGKGGYAKGMIRLNAGEILYFYIGEKGSDGIMNSETPRSFNGGGLGTSDNDTSITGFEAAGAGGGATDVRLVNGAWDDFDSLVSRIMVAGGGGGQSWKSRDGGSGGGINGVSSGSSAGATQTTGYQFGIGKDGNGRGDSDGVAGGGGGYWGGVSGNSSATEVGSGGSGYISGHTGCVAIASASATTPKAGCDDNTTNQSCSIHYSTRTFYATVLLDGTKEVPTYDGTSTMIGNSGHGHAKIRLLTDDD